MARNSVPKAEIDPKAETHAPKTRDEVVQDNRRRRAQEPALAPRETDEEAGDRSAAGAGTAAGHDPGGRPRDPVREGAAPATPGPDPAHASGGDPAQDGAVHRDPADVPAGPGDAGAQSRPRTLPEDLQRDRGGWGRVIAVLGAGAVILVILVLLA